MTNKYDSIKKWKDETELKQRQKIINDALEWAAQWIENSLVGEESARVIEFGKNMAMSFRANKEK
jgi:hypothetical protein